MCAATHPEDGSSYIVYGAPLHTPATGSGWAGSSGTRLGKRLTLIHGLSEYGSTETLAEWLFIERPRADVVWITVEPTSTDSRRFWDLLGSTLATALGRHRYAVEFAVADVGVLLAGLERPLILVVDRLDAVAEEVDAGLLALLSGCPLLRLIALVGSDRYLSAVGPVEFASTIVRPVDLAFGAEEIEREAAGSGVALTLEQSERVRVLLSGNAFAVRVALAALHLRPREDIVDTIERSASNYFRKRLSIIFPDAFAQLLAVSAAPYLTPEIVQCALARDIAPESLREFGQLLPTTVERQGDQTVYRFAPFMQRMLYDELVSRHDTLARDVHRRLGRLFLAKQEYALAVEHLSQAAEWDVLVPALDALFLLLLKRNPTALRGVLAGVPGRVLADHPRYVLFTELARHARATLSETFEAASSRLRVALGAAPSAPLVVDRLYIAITRMMLERNAGRTAQSLAAAAEIEAILTAGPDVVAALGPSRSLVRLEVGRTLLLAGRSAEAGDAFASVARLPDEEKTPDQVRDAQDHEALVLALLGYSPRRKDGVTEHVADYSDRTARLIADTLWAVGRLDETAARVGAEQLRDVLAGELAPIADHARARVALLWEDCVDADALVNRRLVQLAAQGKGSTAASLLLKADAADIAMCFGQLARAKALLDQHPRAVSLNVCRARLALLAGDGKRGLLLVLGGARNYATAPREQVELEVLRACLELVLGRVGEARATADRAVRQATFSGILDVFGGVPHEMLVTLGTLSDEAAGFIETHALATGSRIFRLRSGWVELSRRERVIVGELSAGDTLEDIAARLFVAPNTVKAQLRSIYRKLGVASRGDALLRASELGLIPDALEEGDAEERRDGSGSHR